MLDRRMVILRPHSIPLSHYWRWFQVQRRQLDLTSDPIRNGLRCLLIFTSPSTILLPFHGFSLMPGFKMQQSQFLLDFFLKLGHISLILPLFFRHSLNSTAADLPLPISKRNQLILSDYPILSKWALLTFGINIKSLSSTISDPIRFYPDFPW